MVVGDAALFVVGVLALWVGARLLVTGAARLASAAGVSALVIGLTVVAFGTSAPEIVVSVDAALEGQGDVAVGNVLGSNLFNLGVILGLVAILSPFRVAESVIRRDAVAMAAATVVAAVVLVDGRVSRLEGLVLLALLGGYFGALAVAVRRGHRSGDGIAAGDSSATDTDSALPSAGDDLGTDRLALESLRVVAGLALVTVGGRALVDSAVGLALQAGVSEWVIGATIVAAGTSVPELATSLAAVRRGDVAIAAGNIIGSNVFNLLAVLGLAAIVRPLAVDPAAALALAWLGLVTAFATIVLATGRRLTRLEGVALLVVGVGYWVASAVV